MKKILCTLLLLASLAGALIARAQTNSAVAGQPVDNTNIAVSGPAATNIATVIAVTPATNTVVVAEAVPAIVDTNAAATLPASTNGPAPAAENIPLIQFSDVPITTAIEHLCRQAGINYMLDPKIAYGQPDQNGQIKAEPQLSIRWENITAESALLALLDNYGLQLVVDKKTGIDRVTIKDPLAPPPLLTRVVQLQYASVSNMIGSVQSVMTDKRSKVMADVRTSQLLIVATEPEQQSAEILIAQLDKQTRQVLIEAKLVSISSNPTTAKGVDWTSTLQQQNVTFGNGSIAGNPGNTITTPGPIFRESATTPGKGKSETIARQAPSSVAGSFLQTVLPGSGNWSASTMGSLVPATAFLNADGLHAVVSFLNSSSDAEILSTPRVVTLDNEIARIDVTRGYPYINVTAGTANTTGGSQNNYVPVGTYLQVTPRISANNSIWLDVLVTNSTYAGQYSQTINSLLYQSPLFDDRAIQTRVLVPDSNTLVMGGMVDDEPTANTTKVPFLGDIPGVGWLFHSESKALDKKNLLIFITPSVVKSTDFQPTKTTFLQSKPTAMHSPMNPHKLWDGSEMAEQRNWNNPAPEPSEFENTPITK